MSNRLDPDQARCFVGPGLGPTCYEQMTLVENELRVKKNLAKLKSSRKTKLQKK